jgi:hypothetical protein
LRTESGDDIPGQRKTLSPRLYSPAPFFSFHRYIVHSITSTARLLAFFASFYRVFDLHYRQIQLERRFIASHLEDIVIDDIR